MRHPRAFILGSRLAAFSIHARVFALIVAGLLVATPRAVAQGDSAPATAPESTPQSTTGHWAVVTANDVHVRSGPSVDAAYPFLKLDRGALLKVVEESVGWARVPTIGPSFKEAFGYIRADRKVKLSADGRTAEVLSTVDVLAPNALARFAADSSWKSIGRIEPGRTIAILDTIEGQRDTVHKISLPPGCDGWVNLTFLRKATEQELAGIDPVTGGPRVVEAPMPPPSTPPAAPPSTPPAVQPASPPAAPPVTPSGPGAGTAPSTAPGGTAPPDSPPAGSTAPDRAEPSNVSPATPPSTPATPASAPSASNDGGTAPPPPPPTVAERIERVTLADLERAMEQVRRENVATAEVGPLRQRYLEFADRSATTPNQREFARARAEQLAIQEDAQRRLQELQALLAKNNAVLEVLRGARESMDARQPYTAVGRLNASIIYDGVRLPLLFRLQDPTGGQTIGYMEPGKGFDLSSLLGQLVGVVGKSGYDDALRINTIDPVRIDVLTSAPRSIRP